MAANRTLIARRGQMGGSGMVECAPRGQSHEGIRKERATRIELALSAWEADVLPLNYARENEWLWSPAGICLALLSEVCRIGVTRGESGGSSAIRREAVLRTRAGL
jgi:hypothetical protein